MSRPEVLIHNIEIDEVVIREMNDEELAKFEQDQLEHLALIQAEAEAQAKKQALLDRLGITAEEARLLLS